MGRGGLAPLLCRGPRGRLIWPSVTWDQNGATWDPNGVTRDTNGATEDPKATAWDLNISKLKKNSFVFFLDVEFKVSIFSLATSFAYCRQNRKKQKTRSKTSKWKKNLNTI